MHTGAENQEERADSAGRMLRKRDEKARRMVKISQKGGFATENLPKK
jgi:hypothetical protein